MLIECQNCGAPLDVTTSSRVAVCNYCQHPNQVASTRTMAMQTPDGWMPPSTWTPPSHVAADSARQLAFQHITVDLSGVGDLSRDLARPVKQASGAGCVILVAGLVAAGSLTAFFLLRSPNGSSILGGVDIAAVPTVATIAVATTPSFDRSVPWGPGSIDADTFGSHCEGTISSAPQLALQATAGSTTMVQIDAISPQDLTLVLRAPDGTVQCDDDSGEGMNPRLAAALSVPGKYLVWVGHRHPDVAVTYNLRVDAEAVAGLPDSHGLVPAGPASLGTVSLATSPSGGWQGTGSRRIDFSHLGSQCRGYGPRTPHLVMESPTSAFITLQTASSVDTGLVVRDSAGVFHCDDDSGSGQNAAIRAVLPAGKSAVWVTMVTSNATEGSPFSLQLDSEPLAATPDMFGLAPTAAPTLGVVDLDTAPQGARLQSPHTKAQIETQNLGTDCRGFIPVIPDATIHSTAAHHVRIEAHHTVSGQDLTLAVRMPNGRYYCDDDSAGQQNPRVEVDVAAGTVAIWVGALYDNRPPAPYELVVSVPKIR